MNASEARKISEESRYYKQIRSIAERNSNTTILEFTRRDEAEKARIQLIKDGYSCGKIVTYRDTFGDDFTMEVKW